MNSSRRLLLVAQQVSFSTKVTDISENVACFALYIGMQRSWHWSLVQWVLPTALCRVWSRNLV